MIALISFKDDLIITRDEAVRLKLQFEEVVRVGVKEGRLVNMSASWEVYRDEVTKDENGEYIDANGKSVNSWHIRDRPKQQLDWVHVFQDNQMVDLDWFVLNCSYPFYVKKAIKSEEPSIQNISLILAEVEERAQKIQASADRLENMPNFNQKCNVHVGGGLLVTFNELSLKEDCCTDELQSELNQGWRIVAVCVQPDQRRPDYVLGRFNPTLDVHDNAGAKR